MQSMVTHIYMSSVAVGVIHLPACSDMGHATADMALMWYVCRVCQNMHLVQYRSDWSSNAVSVSCVCWECSLSKAQGCVAWAVNCRLHVTAWCGVVHCSMCF